MVLPAVGGQVNLSVLKRTGARTLTFSGAINLTGNIQAHSGLLRLRSGATPSNGSQPFGLVQGVDGEPLADLWPYLVRFNLAALAAGISEQVIYNFNELPAGENAWAGAASIVVSEEFGEGRLAGPFAQHAAEVGQVFDDRPGENLALRRFRPNRHLVLIERMLSFAERKLHGRLRNCEGRGRHATT